MEWVLLGQVLSFFSLIFAIVGSALIVYGGLVSSGKILFRETGWRPFTYNQIRREFTSKIVFGLEFLIAADILTTVIAPNAQDILLLAAVVIIRTILGYFLSKETAEFQLEA